MPSKIFTEEYFNSLDPDSTPIPNKLIDVWMRELAGSQFKLITHILNIARFSPVTISTADLANKLNVSTSSIKKATRHLCDLGMLKKQHHNNRDGRFKENTYQVNIEFFFDESDDELYFKSQLSEKDAKSSVSQ